MKSKGEASGSETRCGRAEDLPLLLLGLSSAEDTGDLLAHVEACASCARELEDLGAVVSQLKSAPEPPPHPDLTASILAALPEEESPQIRRPSLPLMGALGSLAAAAILLAFMLGAESPGIQEPTRATLLAPSSREAVRLATSFLLKRQEPDGSFEETCAEESQRTALTGLCLGALAETLLDDKEGNRHLDRAVRSLFRTQSRRGRFGEGSLLEHVQATWGLLRLHARKPWPELSDHLRPALAALIAMQLPDGSFGDPHAPEEPRRRTTLWALETLEAARGAGFEGVRPVADAALRWLQASLRYRRTMDPRPDLPPEESLVLTHVGRLLGWSLQDEPLVRKFAANQRKDGVQSGSWSDGEGRLRTTALRLLCLENHVRNDHRLARAR